MFAAHLPCTDSVFFNFIRMIKIDLNKISKNTVFLYMALIPIISHSHSGGLDKYGCHTNSKTGDYHCHGKPPPPPPVSNIISGKVVSVTDGDTLAIQDAKGLYSIRLAEIDAPEKCQAYGPEARLGLVDMAINRSATVEVIDKDRYGRIVGKVLVAGQSESVNKQLLRKGLAWVYDAYVEDFSLNSLENLARNAKLGLWSSTNPMPPWEWRKGDYGCSRDPETVFDGENTEIGQNSKNVTVFEFFNSANQHYFMTANAIEANAIDQGYAGPDWKRTGNTFNAWGLDSDASDTLDVCRFYNPIANSHFFTASSVECNILKNFENDHKKTYGPGIPFDGWRYEGMSFKIKIPTIYGNCPSGTEPIYRAYNNRHEHNDQNHRFSPWADDLTPLQEAGWTLEGVAMCARK